MRLNLAIAAASGAVMLIGFGLMQPVDKYVHWLLCLWLGSLLLGLAVWHQQPPLPRGMARSLSHVGFVIALGFVLLSLQLLRQQVVQANDIYHRLVTDPTTGQITSNVRPVLASQRVIRGKMFDRMGLLLVSSEVVKGGFARRSYPLADVSGFDPSAFGNLVGFFSTRFGQSGLEATYGEYLSGELGSPMNRIQNDWLGNPQVGNDLYLTINANLQAAVSGLLGDRSGSVVVLDPKRGEVLAMASSPGFDPRLLRFDYETDDWDAENERIGRYWEAINSDGAGQPLINRPTQGQYPPGSTFKTVTAIAALEHPDKAKPNDIRCLNELPVEIGAPPVVNAVANLSSFTRDPSNLERVYAYSCNTAFAQYALRLGADFVIQQAATFDFYTPETAPELYPEFTALPTLSSRLFIVPGFLNRPAALADTGYGQGQMLVTPLQMAMVAAAIANNGVMMRPYLVSHIRRPDGGVIFEEFPHAIRQTMSQETAQKMRQNMRAVAKYGFGSGITSFVPNIEVGGKSGTAEHLPGATPHAWFIAIAPVDQPRYAVCVMIETGGEGSSVGAQLAGQVLAAAFAGE